MTNRGMLFNLGLFPPFKHCVFRGNLRVRENQGLNELGNEMNQLRFSQNGSCIPTGNRIELSQKKKNADS